jgi:NTP pyrophosphatase (non-canonical NTP hydrolase)
LPKTFILPLVAEDARSFSLVDWQLFFGKMYGARNLEIKKVAFGNNSVAFLRGYVLAKITEDMGNLAEVTRENEKDPAKTKKYIASVLAWLFALSNELGFQLSDVTFKKYPGICPYCERPNNCTDSWWAPSDVVKDKKPNVSPSNSSKPKTLQQWYKMFDDIYGRKIRVAIPLHDIMHKLYEELAEIFKELNQNNKAGVAFEVPDYVSWFCGLIIKLRHYSFLDFEDVSSVIVEKFGEGCPQCKDERTKKGKQSDMVCMCPFPKWIPA